MNYLIRTIIGVIAPITLVLSNPASSASIGTAPHVRLDGVGVSDALGESATGIGDFNGDGFSDIAVGTSNSAANGSNSGAVYVLFGRANGPSVVRGDQLDGTNGFTFRGSQGDKVGGSIGSFDINSDSKRDLVTAGPGAPNNTNAGMVGIVFGASNVPPALYFPNLNGSTGFRILGTSNSVLGLKTASASDFNGDGRPDLIMGASGITAGNAAGGVRIFLSPNPPFQANYDSGTMPTIAGTAAGGRIGQNVGVVGDVNGDGLADMSVATESFGGVSGQWAIYIIYGRSDGVFSTLPSPDTPQIGIRIIASTYGTSIGREVASLGDVNGDGIDDFAFGEPGKSFPGPFGDSVGAAYVIYGRAGGLPPVDLNNLPPSVGFRVIGENAGDNFGSEVASAGDFNGDGRPDLAFGALQADFNGNASGSLYIMFTGDPPTGDVLASSLMGSQGVRFDGEAPGHSFGRASDRIGDFNNDGAEDLVISAPTAAFNGFNSGSAYVVYGLTAELFRDGFEGVQ